MPETTPLLSSPDGSSYYFLNNDGGVKRDADGGATVEGIPDGANAAEFEPKKLGPKRQVVTQPERAEEPGFLSKLFTMTKREPKKAPSMLKQRKAPIKVEPKVFFANERTFLAWMHISIILA
eukprot:CAMPEP_0176296198 /NCGR_PEP_ID=MMETSP0121_2-20121125/58072_1 /TAXON_ID=160619 /ORGANISM="Kryptoperidinium foliaceum, Strain CCMP 1326" /LENGTH=121 /DNA_ID=CAMNT_0017637327 /DNA_START=44 /DNA_END=406 /DNA_ORIENTATION=-